jgi:hypothetical protein
MAVSKNLRSIAGSQTTAGAAEETVLLSIDGSAPAATIAIPTDQELILSGWVVTAEAAARFKLQQDNGSGFFDVIFLRVAADGTVGITDFGAVSIRIAGGPGVTFRVQVQTPAGASPVTVAIRAYTDSN